MEPNNHDPQSCGECDPLHRPEEAKQEVSLNADNH